jgi:formyltetrahydrofolate deformylase
MPDDNTSRIGDSHTIAHLLISCKDRPGIVASVSTFLRDAGANIVESAQFSTDPRHGEFYMRVVFAIPENDADLNDLRAGFRSAVAEPMEMDFDLVDSAKPKKVAIFVSKQDHCLKDLLWRWRQGQLPIDIGLVISNHPDLRRDVEEFGVRFEHVPMAKEDKSVGEARQLQLLGDDFDLVILARYMQILSDRFLQEVDIPVINIHHSFLPAFAGASPYRRAKERGVKLIGATAHYATRDLDEGPII